MLRGVFHFHSRYSFDSSSSIRSIANMLEELKLDFAILTDHDDIRGSQALRKELKRRKSSIYVPTAAEYSSELGDIIVVGVDEDLAGLPAVKIMRRAKEAGGLVVLPHPFDAHILSDELLDGVDVVEVFNARSSEENNKKSASLANKINKPVIYSPDAHLLSNLKNAIIVVPADKPILESIFQNEVRPVCTITSGRSEIIISQIIKSLKTRNFSLFIRMVMSPLIDRIRRDHPNLFRALKRLRRKR